MPLSAEQFYDELSGHYDEMTRFVERLKQQTITMQFMQDRYKFKSAIDVACGTGLHVCALEKINIPTIGIDISEKMLTMAKNNAQQQNVSPTFIKSGMANITKHVKTKTDVIFCLGNSIPHIFGEEELYFVATKFSTLLNKNGKLIFQLLNYSSILSKRERIVNIASAEHKSIVRFYDFCDPFIQFNVLTFWKESDNIKNTLNNTILFPFQKGQIKNKLEAAGFSNITFYGNLQMEPFDEEASSNLIVVATI